MIELLTAIVLAVAAELLRRKRKRYREQSDPPPELNSDPDATDHDLPPSYRHRHTRPGQNPRSNRHRR